MKKILASILVLTMLVCCMSISAFAKDAPATITIDDVTATAGSTVEIPVNIKVSGDLSAVLVKFSIDSKLEGTSIKRIAAGMWTFDNGTIEANPSNGVVDWYKSSNVDIDYRGEGVMFVYHVNIPATALNGEYTITINCEDWAYVDMTNAKTEKDGIVTSYSGLTTTDTATLTITGGQDAHSHTYGEWKSDAEGHWKECECGEATAKAAHVYDDDKDATCNDCGYEREIEAGHEHAYGEWKSDAEGHWKECECGEATAKAAHVYDNDQDTTCNDCGYEREIEHEHRFVDVKSDAEGHWKECECGEPTAKAAHVYDDDKDTTCNECGYQREIDDGKQEDDKKDETPRMGDSTNLYIYMAICLFAAAAIVVTSYKLKKSRG